MPRYRKLHVKALESLDIHEMPDDFTRLFWVLLPLALDCEGRGIDTTAWLKSKVFPLREDPIHVKISDAFDWFVNRGMVVRYEVAGRRYFYLPTFLTYQGDTGKEAVSEYPTPPGLVNTNSRPTPELVKTKSASDVDVDADVDALSSSSTTPAQKAIEAFLQARGGAVGPTDVDRIDLMAERASAHITALARGSPGAELTGDAWVAAAIEEAVQSQDGRGISLKYIDAILSRWIAQGFKSEMQHKGKKGNGRIHGQKRISIPGYKPPATETAEEFAALPTSGELEDRARLPGVRGDRLAAS